MACLSVVSLFVTRRRFPHVVVWALAMVAWAITSTTSTQAAPAAKQEAVIPPAWSQTLPAAERFVLVLNDEAVLDKETGLVWERRPSNSDRVWIDAMTSCARVEVSGRRGWRLPSLPELSSLIDANAPPATLALPAGHPFLLVPTGEYWTSTSSRATTGNAWQVNFSNEGLAQHLPATSSRGLFWCVRGPGSLEAY